MLELIYIYIHRDRYGGVLDMGDPQVTIGFNTKSWSSIYRRCASGLPLQGELADAGGQEALH